ncbi:hypothetical protein ANSO36C_48030 [Nostoc cf. commune SO-36]|uniref:Response regulatory domain-containing protein n=1 Tax=Nostoc cf. commune SO-36 TaxID=449208 RepID=A0ABM7Z789_NOSCO|nr:hypothetical protein [Nostoc commune]BDI19001.1 hypothetical protein ANSO36C_48030 [Nostoc cf. commune SO-36]
MRSIEVLLIEDSPSDANLTIKGFLNTQITNNFHWVEDGSSKITKKVIGLEISIFAYKTRKLIPV